MRHARVSLLLPLALVVGASSAASAQSRLTGKVFDATTNAPLVDVAISAGDGAAVARTDRGGQFSLACTGAMTLEFSRFGYEPARRSVASCGESVQVGLTPGARSLNAVSVVGTREGASLQQPQSIATLTDRELDRTSGVFLEDALNLIPGVRMEKRTMAGGQRITIRGYGNASNFNGSGYKAYFNGIPITDAEGVTILDDVDVATLGRVEVVRGPASSLYGAGIGGVVNLFTARPDQPGTSLVQETTMGADGLLRSDTRFENVTSGATTQLNYGHQGYDSYRVHSASKKDFVSALGEFRPSERRTVSAFLGYAHALDERAGQLDSLEFFGKQNVGEAPYLANDGHEDIESVRAGISHSYRMTDHLEHAVTAYYGGVTIEDVFAVGLNTKASQNFGGRAVLNATFADGRFPITGVAGAEFQKTNAIAKGNALNNGVLGAMRSDLETHTMQYSLFSQWDVALPSAFTLTVGASANFVEYAIDDRLTNTANPTHLDASGRKTFDPVITPRVALRRMFGDDVSAYVSVSQGYTPPTSADAVIPFTGEANTELAPERATLYEVGTKGNLLGRALSYQLALFDMRVTDKLTPQAVFDESGSALYTYTVNGGDQQNRGAEVAVVYAIVDRPDRLVSLVRPFVTYTYSDFTYRGFVSNASQAANPVDYTGNHVVGVPTHVFDAGVDAALRWGGYLNATYQHVDDMPLTYDNLHRAPGYSLLDAKVGYAHDVGGHLALDAFVGGNNLAGDLYYTMAFLNGNYSGASPKVFLPGPYTTKLYGGLKLSYHL
jgi:iron complex outermembrane receptor protein